MAANRARDAFFIERQIPSILPPHSRTTGFVYGEMDAGVKYARISVVGKGDIEAFDFALPVPGAAFVGTSVRADKIYPDQIANMSREKTIPAMAAAFGVFSVRSIPAS